MDYELSKAVLEMTAPEFEVVFGVLQEFTNAYKAGAFNNRSRDERTAIKDKVRVIEDLKFTFVRGEGDVSGT